ncbi:MAG: hypothetical protein JW940_30160 [Polyangiaceae bacterium]|nr:hypothetical protein [Polyangiaceae bacterium]
MTVPFSEVRGVLFAVGVCVAWMGACRPPGRLVRAALLFALVLFLPYFLLPCLPAWLTDSPDGGTTSFVVPLTILLRGTGGILISAAAVSSLSMGDLREGLLGLPLPNLLRTVLVQIVHQTATLFYETRRVAAAMAVRGASGGGVAAWRVVASLPRVWLPRVAARAERVANAMEVRGYCEGEPDLPRQRRSSFADTVALALSAAVLAGALALRVGALR